MTTDPKLLLQRMLPVLKVLFRGKVKRYWPAFEQRLQINYPALHESLYELYGHRYDFAEQVQHLLAHAARANASRHPELHDFDTARAQTPLWFQSNKAIGGVCYVDRFAGDLDGIRAKIPYFKSLGITYLHLMPLFKCPEGRSDGGYAVSSYREVNPALGDMAQLQTLAFELRREGISLVLDFIYNHTSDQHEWAQKARNGDKKYRDYYFFFPDRNVPDQYEQTLREVFPEERSGNFSWDEELELWVWTTFKSYQWDLNYSNPEVLAAMVDEMLFIANAGVEVLRLDAVVFAWKQMGTACESLPPVYTLVEAFNSMARIAAPSLLFKSEAIVHPDEVVRYISPERCQVSYNPMLMALLWEALATREVKLLEHSLAKRFDIPEPTQWINYVRCHDDIGWTFSDEDAQEVGIHGSDHRQFLNRFYTGNFEGTFARGLPFQYNPKNGDCRVCGSTASLAGLEKALAEGSEVDAELAMKRILLIHSVIYSIGGVPLLYLGDEMGILNDYSYQEDPHHSDDSRWAQRPKFTPAHFEAAVQEGSEVPSLFGRIQKLAKDRADMPSFNGHQTTVLKHVHPRVLAYVREHQGNRCLVLCNFSEELVSLDGGLIREYAGPQLASDSVTGDQIDSLSAVKLGPYQYRWVVAD